MNTNNDDVFAENGCKYRDDNLGDKVKIEDTPGSNIPADDSGKIYTADDFAPSTGAVEEIINIMNKEEHDLINARTIRVKRLSSNATIPTLGTTGSGGWDLYASSDTLITAGSQTLVPTDLAMAIPEGYVGQINPRSSMASKHNIRVGARVIDSDYRGNVLVNLHNDSKEDYAVSKGDRIAQILFMPVLTTDLYEVEELDDTSRDGGFGSTGK